MKDSRRSAASDASRARRQTRARRTALLVATALVAALLGPFVAGYLGA